MFFRSAEGQLRSMPQAWTTVATPDPFVVVAAGRALFRLEDLVALAALVREFGGGHGRPVGMSVKEITP